MQHKYLEPLQLKAMLLAGFENLSANKQQVDALNVFPVPDGDTGTNMSLTVQAAAKEVENLKDLQLKTFAQAAATGALMGARGNSGVILSQLFRGFTQVLETADKVDGVILAKAFQSASEVAYRAVIKPVEGTILTVAKAAAKGAREAAAQENNYEKVISNALQYAQKALDKTPTMLPALAQAGVVDAGGKGLCLLIEGALKSLSGEWHSTESLTSEIKELETKEKVAQSLEFRYCTELIIKGLNLSQDLTRKALEKLGDSLLVVGNANVTKIHIHTNHPGKVLEYAVTQGTLHDIKIDNMEEQHQERYLAGKDEDLEEVNETTLKDVGILGVCAGSGLAEILQSLGADLIVHGGQTMNPSTEDLVAGIKEINAKHIFVLPNNKNIILAAEQAKSLLEDVEVHVIPTKKFPQGMTALVAYDPERPIEENEKRMKEAINQVQTGEITYAVRESQYNGLEIQNGELLGIVNANIITKGNNMWDVAKDLVSSMLDRGGELLTVFYGSDIEAEEADDLFKELQKEFPELEIEMHYGGQPLYYYIFALE
ncbi:MAG TPA: DAK2 domain-containing protein [Clostridia bacterium]|nr:DAK2 domain-containing protein [Clostridia bacterium]